MNKEMFALSSNKLFTVRDILNRYVTGKLDLNAEYQRGYEWSDTNFAQRSLFIESCLYGCVITPLVFNYHSDTKIFEVVDGVQRITTIARFVEPKNNKRINFLTGETEDIFNINGKLFKEFTEDLKNALYDCNMNVYILHDADEDSIREFFCRLNNGKQVNSKTLRHAICTNDLYNCVRNYVSQNINYLRNNVIDLKNPCDYVDSILVALSIFTGEYTTVPNRKLVLCTMLQEHKHDQYLMHIVNNELHKIIQVLLTICDTNVFKLYRRDTEKYENNTKYFETLLGVSLCVGADSLHRNEIAVRKTLHSLQRDISIICLCTGPSTYSTKYKLRNERVLAELCTVCNITQVGV